VPEHRQIRGVSQFEPLYLGGSEPADGVVLVRLHVRNITPPAARDPHSEIQAALRIDTVQDGVAVNAFKLHSQLFGHFPPERIQRAFTRLDMTSGKVPHVWIPPPRRRSMTEQQLLRPPQDHGHDLMIHHPSSVTPDQGEGCQTRHYYCWVYTCRDGLISQIRNFTDTLLADRLFGLDNKTPTAS
jgi:hypothetical protein